MLLRNTQLFTSIHCLSASPVFNLSLRLKLSSVVFLPAFEAEAVLHEAAQGLLGYPDLDYHLKLVQGLLFLRRSQVSSDTSTMKLTDEFKRLVFLPQRVVATLYLKDTAQQELVSSESRREAQGQSYLFQLSEPSSFDRVELASQEGESLAVFRWPSVVPNASFLNLDLPIQDSQPRKTMTPAALHVKDEVRLQLQEELKTFADTSQKLLLATQGLDDLAKQVDVLEKQLEQLRQEVRNLRQNSKSNPHNQKPAERQSGPSQ